jgi:hypothetical protein
MAAKLFSLSDFHRRRLLLEERLLKRKSRPTRATSGLFAP